MIECLRVARIIALSTFRQGLRGRLFFLAVTAAASIVLLGTMFRGFSGKANLELRLILETGLALSAFVVLGTAIILSCRGIGEGNDRASYMAVFSLPIHRDGVHWGHLAGVTLTLAAYTAAMCLAMSVVLYWRFSVWRWSLVVHFFTLFVEAVLLAALATFFALGRSTVVAFFATMAVAIVAHAESVVCHLARESGSPILGRLVGILVKFLPCLSALDVKASAVRDLPVPWSTLAWALAHSLVYLVILLALSSLLRRRMEE